ncbi:hypothetical protein [Persicobacter diffluens]|uniref:Lipoprotein n=1 Tax=Persicobacter diffluens TaxID=981 RepID=A0AAN4VTR9_9BACT|nr:hypothetical protein PEDI_01400 [Persicobacter diffluens]
MRLSLSIAFALAVLLSSCNMDPKKEESPAYFDVKTVENRLKNHLEKVQPAVEQYVAIGQKVEKVKIEGPSVNWENQFKLLDDIDLNKPVLEGLYKVDSLGQSLRYELLNEDTKASVISLEVQDRDGMNSLVAYLRGETLVHKANRKISLKWKDDQLISYEVHGLTKVVMQDTVTYTVEIKPLW